MTCTLFLEIESSVTEDKTSNSHFSNAEFDNISIVKNNVVRLLWITYQRIQAYCCFWGYCPMYFVPSPLEKVCYDGWMMTNLFQKNRTAIDANLHGFPDDRIERFTNADTWDCHKDRKQNTLFETLDFILMISLKTQGS